MNDLTTGAGLVFFLLLYFIGVAIPLLIAYAIIKASVLAALRQHASEQAGAAPAVALPAAVADGPGRYRIDGVNPAGGEMTTYVQATSRTEAVEKARQRGIRVTGAALSGQGG